MNISFRLFFIQYELKQSMVWTTAIQWAVKSSTEFLNTLINQTHYTLLKRYLKEKVESYLVLALKLNKKVFPEKAHSKAVRMVLFVIYLKFCQLELPCELLTTGFLNIPRISWNFAAHKATKLLCFRLFTLRNGYFTGSHFCCLRLVFQNLSSRGIGYSILLCTK